MSIAPITSSMSTAQLQNVRAHDTSSAASTDNTLTESAQSVESTFLTLLAQELQNQDPTAPMDSTAMVGQMISLNQLDQLANINQTLTSAFGSGSSTTGVTAAQAGAPQHATAAMVPSSSSSALNGSGAI